MTSHDITLRSKYDMMIEVQTTNDEDLVYIDLERKFE